MRDVVVIGSGPNGLAAAIDLLRAGCRVRVVERSETIGGGTRTLPLTLPGHLHDVCSAVHPMAVASPFLRTVDLSGVDMVQPPIPVTHPLDGGRVAVLHRDVDSTARGFGRDARRYRRLVAPLVSRADRLADDVLRPLRVPPRHLITVPFGMVGALSARGLARLFTGDEARGLLAGLAAHSIAPLTRPLTAAVALWFATTGHAYGWPIVAGGSTRLGEALAARVIDLGGSIETGVDVIDTRSFGEAVLVLDVMPASAATIASHRIPDRTRRRLLAARRGPGVFKVDWALHGPIPWRDPHSAEAGTVHVGGTFEEVAAAEADVAAGRHPGRPFVLLSQPSLFDGSRAPAGRHTAWAYCHVPTGSTLDMTAAIEAQVERFAPGFGDQIAARHTMGPADFGAANPNDSGGDIAGGPFSLRRLLRPLLRRPYRIGDGVYLCSAATPPGAGVHGMCGHGAAAAALTDLSGAGEGANGPTAPG